MGKYAWHRKRVLDPSLAIARRVSHLRSCALALASLLQLQRVTVIDRVKQATAVDLECCASEAELVTALQFLDATRATALRKTS